MTKLWWAITAQVLASIIAFFQLQGCIWYNGVDVYRRDTNIKNYY